MILQHYGIQSTSVRGRRNCYWIAAWQEAVFPRILETRLLARALVILLFIVLD